MRLRELNLKSRGGSQRPVGLPRMVSPVPANAAVFFEDFFCASVANFGWASGLTATPDTLVNLAPLGHPSWVATEPAGTAGLVGCTAGSTGTGALALTTGATANDTVMVEGGCRGGSATVGSHFSWSDSTGDANILCRFLTSTAVTNENFGIALLPNALAYGTDWITDPDTTLVGLSTSASAIAITRHVASYSGNTAGALVVRLYEATGTDDTSVEIAASISTLTAYKVELAIRSGAVRVYLNEVLVATLATPSVASIASRFSAIAQTTTNAARALNIDTYYQEIGQLTAR